MSKILSSALSESLNLQNLSLCSSSISMGGKHLSRYIADLGDSVRKAAVCSAPAVLLMEPCSQM